MVTSPKMISSAIRPPRETMMVSSILLFVLNISSFSGSGIVYPAAPMPVGMMEIVWTGPTSGSSWNRIAWPVSWASRDLLLLLGDHLALLLRTDSDLHECLIDISLENIAAGLLCSENCRLI